MRMAPPELAVCSPSQRPWRSGCKGGRRPLAPCCSTVGHGHAAGTITAWAGGDQACDELGTGDAKEMLLLTITKSSSRTTSGSCSPCELLLFHAVAPACLGEQGRAVPHHVLLGHHLIPLAKMHWPSPLPLVWGQHPTGAALPCPRDAALGLGAQEDCPPGARLWAEPAGRLPLSPGVLCALLPSCCGLPWASSLPHRS